MKRRPTGLVLLFINLAIIGASLGRAAVHGIAWAIGRKPRRQSWYRTW